MRRPRGHTARSPRAAVDRTGPRRPEHPFARPKPSDPALRELEQKAGGLLLGLACGDALGYPVENKSLARIREHYGRAGLVDLGRPARWSDDTQQAAAVTEALARAGGRSGSIVVREVAWELLNWVRSPDNNRSPDPDSLHGARQLATGLGRGADPKAQSGAAAVRALPVGFLYAGRPSDRDQLAEAIARLTHGHPSAARAARAVALLVELALTGKPPSEWLAKLEEPGWGAELGLALARLREAESLADPDVAMQRIGTGWVAPECVALALYAVRRHPDDFRAAVVRSVNLTGDSDTIGAIAGGWMGARLGRQAIPPAWIRALENPDYLLRLGGALARRRRQLRGG